jgi:hypothetical protein
MISKDKKASILKAVAAKAEKYKFAGQEREYKVFTNAVREAVENDNFRYIEALQGLKRLPVTIREFITSSEFLGGQGRIFWPKIIEEMELLCPDVWMGEKQPVEVILTGGTSIAKTFRANLAMCYTLYQMTCFYNPQEYFGLSKDKPIVFGCSSARPMTSKINVLKPVIGMFTSMPYTKKNVNYNKDKIKTTLEIIDQNIIFQWFSADREAYMGHDIMMASAEEVNAMKFINKSVRTTTSEGAGVYDQASELMSELLDRHKGRFRNMLGPRFGGIYTVSSSNHHNDYTSKRIESLSKLDAESIEGIYISRKARWELVPEEWYPSNKTFYWLLTTRDYQGKILTDEEYNSGDYPTGGEVLSVPIEHKDQFILDPDTAQRDIAGRPASIMEVFIRDSEKITACVQNYRNLNRTIFTRSSKNKRPMQNFDLALDGMPEIIPENLPKDRTAPRILHVDIATGSKSGKSDKCAIAMVKYLGSEAKEVMAGHIEKQANYEVEMAISITPSGGQEIMIEDIRNFAMEFSLSWGLNIILFSFDQHQSKESQQKIVNAGFRVNQFSCRKVPESYYYLKDLIYSERVYLPPNELMVEELQYLQQDPKNGKVGHAPGMHDDITDAIASAIYQFTLIPAFSNSGMTDVNGNTLQTRRHSTVRPNAPRRSKVVRRRYGR